MAAVQGPAGPSGPAGPAGVSGYEVVSGAAVSVSADAWVAATAACPTGKVAIGGGIRVADPANSTVIVASSYPALANGISSWNIVMQNWDYYSATITPYAVCAAVATS